MTRSAEPLTDAAYAAPAATEPDEARATPPTVPSSAPSSAPASDPGRWGYVGTVLVLGSLVALGPLTIDMYLAALPQVGQELQASDSQVQFTLTGIMLGLALGQLLLGPVSDAVGRRRPVLVGLVVHAVTSVACALAASIELLAAVRILQGVAGAAISVSVMAIVRDRFTGRKAAGILSHLMLVIGVAPVLAPTIGGWILVHTDWRGIFWVLAATAVALVVMAALVLRETLPVERRRSARPLATLRTYGTLLRDRPFVGLVLTTSLMFGVLFSYVAGSSFVLQGVYGLNEQQFGLVFGANAVGLVLASQVNPFLLRRFSPQQVLTAAVVAGLAAAVALLAAAAAGAPLWAVLVPLGVSVAMAGFTFPNAPALALSRHGESAGTAAAVLGAVQFGAAGVISPLVGVFGTSSAVPMAAVMAASAGAAALVLFLVVRPWQLPALDD